jgi:hypothetical protein
VLLESGLQKYSLELRVLLKVQTLGAPDLN